MTRRKASDPFDKPVSVRLRRVERLDLDVIATLTENNDSDVLRQALAELVDSFYLANGGRDAVLSLYREKKAALIERQRKVLEIEISGIDIDLGPMPGPTLNL
jgi:hypothetical protein